MFSVCKSTNLNVTTIHSLLGKPQSGIPRLASLYFTLLRAFLYSFKEFFWKSPIVIMIMIILFLIVKSLLQTLASCNFVSKLIHFNGSPRGERHKIILRPFVIRHLLPIIVLPKLSTINKHVYCESNSNWGVVVEKIITISFISIVLSRKTHSPEPRAWRCAIGECLETVQQTTGSLANKVAHSQLVSCYGKCQKRPLLLFISSWI